MSPANKNNDDIGLFDIEGPVFSLLGIVVCLWLLWTGAKVFVSIMHSVQAGCGR
jgi:hypothetical protein